MKPLDDSQKKDPNFDESGLKHELGWVNRQEVWYDTLLAIRYAKVEIARGLEEPYYRCMGLSVFSKDRQIIPIHPDAYEQEKKNSIHAGRLLFITNPGTETGAAAEQVLLDHFEKLMKTGMLGRVNILKVMSRHLWEGPNRLFEPPKTGGGL